MAKLKEYSVSHMVKYYTTTIAPTFLQSTVFLLTCCCTTCDKIKSKLFHAIHINTQRKSVFMNKQKKYVSETILTTLALEIIYS